MKFKIAVGAAILSVIGLGVSSAAIPDSTTGVITACRSSIGQLKVIDKQAGASCSVYGETEMSWNQTGPAGATGPQGPAGVSGITGYQLVENRQTVFIQGPFEPIARCLNGKKILSATGHAYSAGVILPFQVQIKDDLATASLVVYGDEMNTARTVDFYVQAICAYVS